MPESGMCASRRAYSLARRGVGTGRCRGERRGWVGSEEGGSSAAMRAWAAARAEGVGSGSMSGGGEG